MAGATLNQPDKSVIALTAQASVEGVIPLTIGQTATCGRAFAANCTVAGNVTVQFYNGAQSTYPVAVGLNVFPFAISQVVSSTATANYENWI